MYLGDTAQEILNLYCSTQSNLISTFGGRGASLSNPCRKFSKRLRAVRRSPLSRPLGPRAVWLHHLVAPGELPAVCSTSIACCRIFELGTPLSSTSQRPGFDDLVLRRCLLPFCAEHMACTLVRSLFALRYSDWREQHRSIICFEIVENCNAHC